MESMSLSQQQPSPKRSRISHGVTNSIPQRILASTQPPPTELLLFINFIVSSDTTADNVRSLIKQFYTSESFPEKAIGDLVHFSMIPRNTQHKQGHISILNQSATSAILNFFNTIDNTAESFISNIPPPTGTQSTHIDCSPTADNSPPTNCRIIGCRLHGLGTTLNSKDNLTPNLLEAHGISFHENYYDPHQTIHWFRCSPPCTSLCFTANSLTLHQSTCSIYQQQLETSNQPFNQISTKRLQWLRNQCPSRFSEELEQLIANGVQPSRITAQVVDWIESTTPALTMNSNNFHCPIIGCRNHPNGNSTPFTTLPTLLCHLKGDSHTHSRHLIDHSLCNKQNIFRCTHSDCADNKYIFFQSLRALNDHNSTFHPLTCNHTTLPQSLNNTLCSTITQTIFDGPGPPNLHNNWHQGIFFITNNYFQDPPHFHSNWRRFLTGNNKKRFNKTMASIISCIIHLPSDETEVLWWLLFTFERLILAPTPALDRTHTSIKHTITQCLLDFQCGNIQCLLKQSYFNNTSPRNTLPTNKQAGNKAAQKAADGDNY